MRVILAMAAGALLASPTPSLGAPAPGHAPDCLCRAPNRIVRVGETICLNGHVAECVMVLNNTSWKITDAVCPVSWLSRPAGR